MSEVVGDLVLEWSKQARQRAAKAVEGAREARAAAERRRQEVGARRHWLPVSIDDVDMSDERLYEAKVRAERAHERARRAQERAVELAVRRAELEAGQEPYATWRAAQAEEAARRAVDDARVADRLAIQGYEHASAGKSSSAAVHEQLAEALDVRAARQPDEQPELLEDARRHRAAARSDRQESATDHEAAKALRRRQ
jgi:hypothetical protein